MQYKNVLYGVFLLMVEVSTSVVRWEHINENEYNVGITQEIPSLFCDKAEYTSYIEDELQKENIDACCRVLDECAANDHILPNHYRYGLHNKIPYIATPCDCNAEFVNCLKRTNTTSSLNIYAMYISSVRKCFKFEFPKGDCQRRDVHRSCISYNFMDGYPKHQFFDQYVYYGEDDDGVLRNQTKPTIPPIPQIRIHQEMEQFQYPFLPQLPFPPRS